MTDRPVPATSRNALRARNERAVFNAVHREGPISRADIAAHTRLSPAAVTNITGDLIARGLLFEAHEGDAKGVGRRPILLKVAYDAGRVAGIKIAEHGLTWALTNLKSEVVQSGAEPLPDTDPEAVIDTVAATFDALRTSSETPVLALGVNLPAIVDADRATVRSSPLFGWQRIALGERLEDRLGVGVLVENDVNALAQAEAWFGYGRDHDDFLVLTLGRGVGLGIVLSGEVYRGPHGGAGEFGHAPLGCDADGEIRTVEDLLSDGALVAAANAGGNGTFADAAGVAKAADAGDAAATAAIRQAGTGLGLALATLVNVFAPTLIVLGGEGMRAAEQLLPPARRALADSAFGDLGERVALVHDAWGDDAWARGAAGLAASRYLATRSVGR